MLTNEMTGIISELLFREGCSEWYLFGFHVTGEANENSDIDIGVKGLPVRKFFEVHSALEDATKRTRHQL